ncbi:MAG: glycosyltransferase family 2 protein [Verrucomicrobia bacterium]|jgi:dolichol-phosphate mannosyltransferase|nr:glycosyltransferase family 2 protein [Verrucomicrobiota bacterium]MDA1006598.1 glycosyltransferase family 2 protein [Verrucomicrobiota bacterium]
MKLSIVMPVYNEIGTIDEILARVRAVPLDKEIIVVDDCSTDGTRAHLERYADDPVIRVFHHDRNCGKGRAIRTALQQVTGGVVVIQDADLEYDPADLPGLLAPIERGEARVVCGSRHLGPGRPCAVSPYYLGGKFLNWLTCRIYRIHLTDAATCYKMIETDLLRSLDLRCERFEFCAEVIAKLAKRGIPILELPISYAPRDKQAGKKLRWWDGFGVLWTLLRCKLAR